MVDDCRSKQHGLRGVRSATRQRFMPVIVPAVHLGTFFHTRNKLIDNADDSTLIAIVPSRLGMAQ